MANGYGGIAELLLHHQLSHWLAHDVATAEDNTLLSTSLDVVVAEQCENTQRSG